MDKFLLGFFSFGWLRGLDFLAPLALRLYLAPMFWVSGAGKLGLFSSSDFEWYNPFSWINMDSVKAASASFGGDFFAGFGADLLTMSVASVEIVAALLLILGFAVRWITVPLIFIVGLVGFAALGGTSLVDAGTQFVASHGYTNITNSSFEVMIVNVIMLFTLFFMGAGRFVSLDWFIYRGYFNKMENKQQKEIADEDLFDMDTATDSDEVKV